MSLFDLLNKKNKTEPEAETPAPALNRAARHNVRAHTLRTVRPTPADPAASETDLPATPEEATPGPARQAKFSRAVPSDLRTSAGGSANKVSQRFNTILQAGKGTSQARLPNKYLVRTAVWDVSSVVSLVVNAILLGVVLLLAARISSLQNTLTGLLGGLYDNFVRMDRSYITTTIAVEDMPIPLDFILPVVQEQTNVTLTQDVTIRNAYVIINTGTLNINAPATVTLPAGTSLPVSLRMDVPVQTTVLMDLQVPVNIQLASANAADPSIANLHTAFLGLQDTIGPLSCLLEPGALDYLGQPLCDEAGKYLVRRPLQP